MSRSAKRHLHSVELVPCSCCGSSCLTLVGRYIVMSGLMSGARNASYRISSLHTLIQRCPLIPGGYRLGVVVPEPLLDVGLVSPSPLLNEFRYIGDRLVIASRIALSETCSVCPERLLASIDF